MDRSAILDIIHGSLSGSQIDLVANELRERDEDIAFYRDNTLALQRLVSVEQELNRQNRKALGEDNG